MFRRPPIRPRPINPPGEFIPIPKYQLPIRPPEGIYPPRPIDGNPIERPLPYRPRLGDLLKDEIRRYKETGEPSSILQNLPQNNNPSTYTELNYSPTLLPMQLQDSNIYQNPNGDINKNPNGDGAQPPKFQQVRQLMSKGPSK